MVAHGTLDNGTEVNVTLNDICYKPLAPENQDCTVMSVLNYFQNNFTRLNHTENFGLVNNSYHIEYCTRYVYVQCNVPLHSCLLVLSQGPYSA